MTTPLSNEKRPVHPINPWNPPPNTFTYKVHSGDSWISLGARNHHEYGEAFLIWLNFGLNGLERFFTEQVNWYLREYVGCKHSLDHGRNWAFTDDADPGIIYMPVPTYKMDAIDVTGTKGVKGNLVAVYDDKNLYDLISHAMDIYGGVDLATGTLEISLGSIVEAGMVVLGPLVSAVAPLVALGAPYNDILKYHSRRFFFDGFCSPFVMTADGWSTDVVEAFYPQMTTAPAVPALQEKQETFRKLYNFGRRTGMMQGKRLSTVEIKDLFVLLLAKLNPAEQADYSGAVKDWSYRKKRDYYDRLGSILKQYALDNNLQITLR